VNGKPDAFVLAAAEAAEAAASRLGPDGRTAVQRLAASLRGPCGRVAVVQRSWAPHRGVDVVVGRRGDGAGPLWEAAVALEAAQTAWVVLASAELVDLQPADVRALLRPGVPAFAVDPAGHAGLLAVLAAEDAPDVRALADAGAGWDGVRRACALVTLRGGALRRGLCLMS
jgi:hypothetical protein